MQRKHVHVISTVGTSLFYPNMATLPDESSYDSWLRRQPESDRSYLHYHDLVRPLKDAFTNGQWSLLATLLRRLPPESRLLGAEINSIYELQRAKLIAENPFLYFLYSDTKDGENIASVLQEFYNGKITPIRLSGLDDQNPDRFQSYGLRSLSKELVKIIRESHPSHCAINATGGYKAQVAIAVIVGVIVSALVFAWEHAKQMQATTHIGDDGSKIYELRGPLFFGSVHAFNELFDPRNDPDDVVIDFYESRVADHSGIEAIDALAERYQRAGKTLHLKHLSEECKRLLC